MLYVISSRPVRIWMIAGASLFASSGGFALDLPHKYHEEHKYEDKQYGYIDININKKGLAIIKTKFSNGKTFDGDHFVALTRLQDSDGDVLAAVRHKRGLNPSYFGAANEGELEDKIRLSESQWARVTDIDVDWYFEDEVDDKAVWRAIKKLAEAWAASSKDDDSNDEGGSSAPNSGMRALPPSAF